MTEHWRVSGFEKLSVPEVHVNAAGKARVEASHRSHDVNAAEVLRAVLFEDRSVLHCVFVWARRAVNVAGICIPRRWRIGMIIGYLAVANDDVMREHAAYCLMKAASDGVVRDLEIAPRFGLPGVQRLQRLFAEVERRRGRVGLEIRPGAVALDGIAPLWNLPLEFDIRLHGRFRQIDLHAMTGRFDITDIHLSGQRGRPQARDRSAAGIEREIFAGALVVPTRRHDPRVVLGEIALLRAWRGCLIPRMALVDKSGALMRFLQSSQNLAADADFGFPCGDPIDGEDALRIEVAELFAEAVAALRNNADASP